MDNMSKRTAIIIFAILIALTPFLGFPRSWENVFIAAAGVVIVLLTANFSKFRKKTNGRRGVKRGKKIGPGEVYVEHIPHSISVRSSEDSKDNGSSEI